MKKNINGTWYGTPDNTEIITHLARRGYNKKQIVSVSILSVSQFRDPWGNYKIKYMAIVET